MDFKMENSYMRIEIAYQKMTDYGSTFRVIVSKKELIFGNNYRNPLY